MINIDVRVAVTPHVKYARKRHYPWTGPILRGLYKAPSVTTGVYGFSGEICDGCVVGDGPTVRVLASESTAARYLTTCPV